VRGAGGGAGRASGCRPAPGAGRGLALRAWQRPGARSGAACPGSGRTGVGCLIVTET
jgi:hypothetical protein